MNRAYTIFITLFFLVICFIPVRSANSETSKSNKNLECLVDRSALDDINLKQEKLKKKESDLIKLENELNAREESLNARFNDLNALKNKISKIEVLNNSKKDERISKLVSTMEKMSPKASSKMLEKLYDELAVESMSRISTEKLAKILNTMNEKVSARLASLLAMSKNVSSDANTLKKKGGEKSDRIN